MISIALIRHGTTRSNMEGRFVGRVDDPITPQAAEDIRQMASCYAYPEVEKIYRSPLTRCRQTMEEIYPNRQAVVLEGLKEIDFGIYEKVLAWEAMEQLGAQPIRERRRDFTFPGGESFGDCLNRGKSAMDLVVKEAVSEGISRVAVVTHSMWISIFLRYCLSDQIPGRNLFCPNGMGIEVRIEPKEWFEKQVVHFGGYIPEGAKRTRIEDSPYHYQPGGLLK